MGSGRKRISELGVVAHLAFPVALPTLLVLTGQELVPFFLEFRFSEIAVNRTMFQTDQLGSLPRDSTPSICISESYPYTLPSFSKAKGQHTGGSLRPWVAPGSASHRHFTPTKAPENAPGKESGGRLKLLGDLVTSGRGPRSWECVTSASFLGMGPQPSGPLSRRHAPVATLPGAGRHNRVSWAGITLPSPARPGPGGGPGASEPVRLGPGRGQRVGTKELLSLPWIRSGQKTPPRYATPGPSPLPTSGLSSTL